jgi:2-oxoglutarate dehydrogenase E2 component (dihydrolipoamide succinyltransferase)
MIEIKVPDLGESIDSATIGSVLKKAGDFVKKDELIAEIETDKVVLEICAPAAGTIAEIKFKSQDIVKSGETFAIFPPIMGLSAQV